MDPTDIKNNEIDQTVLFDLEKNQDADSAQGSPVHGQDASRGSKMKQEPSVRPLRRKRRQLAGW